MANDPRTKEAIAAARARSPRAFLVEQPVRRTVAKSAYVRALERKQREAAPSEIVDLRSRRKA